MNDLAKMLLTLLALVCSSSSAFNLHDEGSEEFVGATGSYFGYSLDFYNPGVGSRGIVVGAPKGQSGQANVTEGGAVFLCPWPQSSSHCTKIDFNRDGDRYQLLRKDAPLEQMEFQSHQWFGASVRSQDSTVLACAPLYSWRTYKLGEAEREPVGTCYLVVGNFSHYAEYAPCRTSRGGSGGQGSCQAGFSSEITKDGRVVLGGPGSFFWQGQVISAPQRAVLQPKASRYLLRTLRGQVESREGNATADDGYMGYSITMGEFTGDSVQEYVTGVPKGSSMIGHVLILSHPEMSVILNVTGDQLASYFGHTVVVTDINNDGLDDLLVGAPMYMAQGEDGRLQERGQVYLYMQQTPKQLVRSQVLLGSDIYGRFGSAIAALGDVDQDGYNDVAIGMPFGGDNMGLVFIYNGLETGLKTDPSQTLRGQWANRAPPQGFGFALRGGTDLDSNGYPDLLVGAFGVDKAVLYRARPVVSVNSQLNISPLALNPENKTCSLPGSSLLLSCFVVQYCLEISGKGLPASVALRIDIQLDQLKERGAIKRTLFQQQNSTRFFTHVQLSQAKQTICRSLGAVLKDEREFRDKLSPVVIGFNYSLDMTHKPENKSVPPILNHYISKSLTQQAHILLDCGKDNICVPDLHLSGSLDRSKVFIGEEHPLILSLYCSNAGEGAYEAELVVELPEELEYDGTYNSDKHHLALACTYKLQNSTKMVICDLGNPMKAGTSVLLKLRFSFTQLTNLTTSLAFHGKLRSSNQVPSKRQTLTLSAEVAVSANLIIRGPFRPAEPAVHVSEWPAVHNPNAEFDVGPQLQQVIQLYNDGPSSVQSAWLRIEIPLQFEQERLLYPIYLEVEGPLNCSSNMPLNPLQLSISRGQNQSWHTSKPPDRVRRDNSRRSNIQPIADCEHGGCLEISCQVGHLPKRNSTVLYINSRLWASFFHKAENSAVMLQTRISFQATEMPFPILPQELPHGSIIVNATIVRIIRDYKRPVPYHVIFLAVLAGLLLLSLLVYALWKCGFFKRDRFLHNEFPAEKAFLKPRQNGTQA